jgi:hypothetical protein
MHNAQVSVEAVIIIAIVLIIFLGAIILIIQKTELSKPIIDESKNFAECQKIAEAIALVQTAEAITEQTLTIENDIHIEKNNIIVGTEHLTSCNYFGKIEDDDSPEKNFFHSGTIIISKTAGGKINVVQS